MNKILITIIMVFGLYPFGYGQNITADILTSYDISVAETVVDVKYDEIYKSIQDNLTKETVHNFINRVSLLINESPKESKTIMLNGRDGIVFSYLSDVFNMPYSDFQTWNGLLIVNKINLDRQFYIPAIDLYRNWFEDNMLYAIDEQRIKDYTENITGVIFTSYVQNYVNNFSDTNSSLSIDVYLSLVDIATKNTYYSENISRQMIAYFIDKITQ